MRVVKRICAYSLMLALVTACGGSADPDDVQDPGSGANTTEAANGDPIETATTAAPGARDFLTLRFNTLIRVNPDDGTVTELGEVDGTVLAVTSGAGSVWMARDDGSVVRMSPGTGEIEAEIDTGVSDPGAIIAFSDEGVWTVHGIVGSSATVSMIDPVTNVAHHTVAGPEGGYILDLAAGEGAGWGVGSSAESVAILFRFDPGTGALDQFDTGVGSSDVVTGGGYVWVVGSGFGDDGAASGGVGRFDPSAGTTEFFPIGDDPENIHYAFDSVWVGDPLGEGNASVHRLDPDNGQLLATIPVGDRYAGSLGLYSGAGFLWAYTDNGLFVVDPSDNSIAGEGDTPAFQALLFP